MVWALNAYTHDVETRQWKSIQKLLSGNSAQIIGPGNSRSFNHPTAENCPLKAGSYEENHRYSEEVEEVNKKQRAKNSPTANLLSKSYPGVPNQSSPQLAPAIGAASKTEEIRIRGN